MAALPIVPNGLDAPFAFGVAAAAKEAEYDDQGLPEGAAEPYGVVAGAVLSAFSFNFASNPEPISGSGDADAGLATPSAGCLAASP